MNEEARKPIIRSLTSIWTSRHHGWVTARIVLLVLFGAAAAIMIFEDRLIYFPSRYPEGNWKVNASPRHEGEVWARVEDIWLVTSDAVKLHGWYCTPVRTEHGNATSLPVRQVLLWLHGNAGNITDRYDMIEEMVKLPVEIFIIDYRGYGRSEGRPSEEGLYRDASAAWEFLVNTRGIDPHRVIIFGKSLGGAVAIELATRVEPGGLIVQSSFTSVADMADTVVPIVVRPLLRTRMDSLGKISRVSCRKLFVHSRADEVVPFELGHRLYEAASQPKEFYEVKGARHNETYLVGGAPYFSALRDFLKSCPE
ncbi:MAG TPA: alpha/beta hydrolase [Blastocatellia bacterium]|nr:alpha/beta hydrolase [Blastocatellia bacterium]